MDSLRIQGGRTLSGTVTVSGAKNAALPEMAAALLTSEPVRLTNLPSVRDVRTMHRLIEQLGARCDVTEDGIAFRATDAITPEAPYDLVRTMRASVVVLGPLLARFGRARVSLPGGCAIGARPIDMHLEGLRRLGAEIHLEHGYVEASAQRLEGGEFTFRGKTVTGTENLMMAACLAKGRTVLHNCACEPEIVDLAEMLRKMGASIAGDGTDTMEIDGVEALGGAEHRVIADRIEAGTYVVAGALCGGEVVVDACRPEHMPALLDAIRRAGIELETGENRVTVRGGEKPVACDVATAPWPGFPTDMQAQFMALMTQAEGTSVITETIFEHRFLHALELQRMGARIGIEGHNANVRGPAELSGAEVTASDLRASACLVLAGLVATGETVVHRVYHIDRGYERIEEKLGGLGAAVERVGGRAG